LELGHDTDANGVDIAFHDVVHAVEHGLRRRVIETRWALLGTDAVEHVLAGHQRLCEEIPRVPVDEERSPCLFSRDEPVIRLDRVRARFGDVVHEL
jgi:hypothetical protein